MKRNYSSQNIKDAKFELRYQKGNINWMRYQGVKYRFLLKEVEDNHKFVSKHRARIMSLVNALSRSKNRDTIYKNMAFSASIYYEYWDKALNYWKETHKDKGETKCEPYITL